MTRSSAVWATDIEANDLGDDKPTSSRASISLPFDDGRDEDDEEEDFSGAEAKWYVPVSIFSLPLEIDLFIITRRKDARDFLSRSIHYFSSHIIPANERETERKKMRDRDTTFKKK
eukprot:scaffold58053_cov67-Attheya_sp.AAC.1